MTKCFYFHTIKRQSFQNLLRCLINQYYILLIPVLMSVKDYEPIIS